MAVERQAVMDDIEQQMAEARANMSSESQDFEDEKQNGANDLISDT